MVAHACLRCAQHAGSRRGRAILAERTQVAQTQQGQGRTAGPPSSSGACPVIPCYLQGRVPGKPFVFGHSRAFSYIFIAFRSRLCAGHVRDIRCAVGGKSATAIVQPDSMVAGCARSLSLVPAFDGQAALVVAQLQPCAPFRALARTPRHDGHHGYPVGPRRLGRGWQCAAGSLDRNETAIVFESGHALCGHSQIAVPDVASVNAARKKQGVIVATFAPLANISR